MLTILLAVALFSGASAADDFCVKSACGCGADGKPWCSEDVRPFFFTLPITALFTVALMCCPDLFLAPGSCFGLLCCVVRNMFWQNYKVGGSWCNANSANCGNCGGDWCAAAAAEYSYSYGPFCVKTACGCDADGKDWCDREVS